MARSSNVVISRPLSFMLPPETRPVSLGSNPIIDRLVTDFPDPLSPTIAKVSPLLTSKLTPSTARTDKDFVRLNVV